MSARAALLTGLLCATVAGCGGDDAELVTEPTEEPATTATAPAGKIGDGAGGVKLEKIGDFDQPLYLTQAPGAEDLYVVEQGGRVRIVRDGHTLDRPLLDLSDEVTAGGEQGLLSIAFAPDFQDSRLLYVYFTGTEQDQHVVEFEANEDGTSVDPGRRELLRMDDFAANHNGGLLLFGPDGQLYIGTGDGGAAGDPERNGQDLGSLLGKILRIDPKPSSTAATNTAADQRPYSVPADNPFVGRSGARPEVYDYGLRNPWRFSFDRETGALLIGDVGQNAVEEIDYLPAGRTAGANFGWSAFEGDERFNDDQEAANAVAPILTYGLGGGNCAVTGGYVSRDPALPSLFGRYLYGDFCRGELRSLVPSPQGARGDRPLGLSVPQLSSFGEDSAGRLYATSLSGPVFRLVAQ
ncbi:MAG: PQQ-dependent sugar dehydrogenase [Solirubrobacterales bacterium]